MTQPIGFHGEMVKYEINRAPEPQYLPNWRIIDTHNWKVHSLTSATIQFRQKWKLSYAMFNKGSSYRLYVLLACLIVKPIEHWHFCCPVNPFDVLDTYHMASNLFKVEYGLAFPARFHLPNSALATASPWVETSVREIAGSIYN